MKKGIFMRNIKKNGANPTSLQSVKAYSKGTHISTGSINMGEIAIAI
jgi:hypothetical protein